LRHLEKRLGLGLERSRSGLETKIEGLGLGKIWEGLVSVSNKLSNVSFSKEKVSFTSLLYSAIHTDSRWKIQQATNSLSTHHTVSAGPPPLRPHTLLTRLWVSYIKSY